MDAPMYTLLLVDGCHYITADDANRVASAIRDGCDSVDVVSHVTAMPNTRRDARVATKDVIKLIVHDVPHRGPSVQPVSISSARTKRNGRSGSTIPFSTR